VASPGTLFLEKVINYSKKSIKCYICNWISTWKMLNSPLVQITHKITSKWIIDLNLIAKAINIFAENRGKSSKLWIRPSYF
jgi:hypothetical protein